jgi:hypothetical protein
MSLTQPESKGRLPDPKQKPALVFLLGALRMYSYLVGLRAMFELIQNRYTCCTVSCKVPNADRIQ